MRNEQKIRAVLCAGFAALCIVALTTPAGAIAPACQDGVDNDRDGFADHPADKGCSGPTDTTEADPALAGSFELASNANAIDVSGTLAYVAYGDFGLAVLDVSDPTNPVLIGKYTDFPGDDLQLVGNHVFMVSKRPSKLLILDVSTPSHPTLSASYDIANVSSPETVFVADGHAYIGGPFENFEVVDVSDPAHPALAGALVDSRVSCEDIAVAGTLAYCTNSNIDVIDVSDPTNPTYVRSVSAPGAVYGLTLSDTHLYATGCYLMASFDLTTPSNPSYVGGVDIGHECGRRVTVQSGLAYVSQRTDGLRIVDVSNPAAPSNLSVFAGISAVDAAIVSGRAYVAFGGSGMSIVDVSTPSSPTALGSLPSSPGFLAIEVAGRYAYFGDRDQGLRVLDISIPAAPNEVANVTLADQARDIRVEGEHAFVAAASAGLEILDVSDPSAPTPTGGHATAESAVSIEVVGNLAYVAEGSYGSARLEIFDIADPTEPAFLGGCDFDSSDRADGIAVEGTRAYVSLYNAGDSKGRLGIVDVTTALAPTVVTEYSPPDVGYQDDLGGLDVVGNVVFLASDAGLLIVDVSNPASPSSIATFPGSFVDVTVADSVAYLTSDDDLLEMVNVLDPHAPYLVGELSIAWIGGVRLEVRNGNAYIAADERDLQIVRLDDTCVFVDGFESGDMEIWTCTNP